MTDLLAAGTGRPSGQPVHRRPVPRQVHGRRSLPRHVTPGAARHVIAAPPPGRLPRRTPHQPPGNRRPYRNPLPHRVPCARIRYSVARTRPLERDRRPCHADADPDPYFRVRGGRDIRRSRRQSTDSRRTAARPRACPNPGIARAACRAVGRHARPAAALPGRHWQRSGLRTCSCSACRCSASWRSTASSSRPRASMPRLPAPGDGVGSDLGAAAGTGGRGAFRQQRLAARVPVDLRRGHGAAHRVRGLLPLPARQARRDRCRGHRPRGA